MISAVAERATTALRDSSVLIRDRWPARPSEPLVLFLLICFSMTAHAWNMFGYPYYENDEATYVSRGWAFITSGQLDVYTYRYDHAPVGWMLIGAWLGLTGGDALFGSMLASGRIFMALVHLASTVLVYLIARRVSAGSMTAGVIAVIVFAASPLGIYFQRRILLDNLMALAVLIAVALLLLRRVSLGTVIASGIVFGLAVLIKLNAAFFGLGFLVFLWARSTPGRRVHVFAQWLMFAGATVGLFFLYAALNQELLSAPLDEDGLPLHVSLVDTFQLQLGRGAFAWPWESDSSFRQAVDSWVLKDPLTLGLGAAGFAVCAIWAVVLRRRTLLPLGLVMLVVGYVLFLARGKVVIDLYIAPLLPFLAILVGVAAGLSLMRVTRRVARPAIGGSLVVGMLAAYVVLVPSPEFGKDETTNQELAIEWITSNVDEDAAIAADNYVYPALAQENGFTDTMYFFNAEYDPEARELYGDDWRNLEYLVVTHEVVEQVGQGIVPDVRRALDHSVLRADFSAGSSSFIDLDKYISTNGDWVRIYQVRGRGDIVLQDAWTHYRDEFVVSYGQVVVSERDREITTTADQAMALDQALQQDDEAAFRGIWQWAVDHFQHREDDDLLSSRWVTDDNGDGSLATSDTVCGADLRIMALLYRASTTWADADDLAASADAMAGDWWEQCTFRWRGLRVMDSSADGSLDDRLINPSYFDPAAITTVAEHTGQARWQSLIDGEYRVLARVLASSGSVPDWAVLRQGGGFGSARGLIAGQPNAFGEDSLRLVLTLIRAEQDGDERATRLLDALVPEVEAYADANPGRPAAVVFAALSQVRDLGVSPTLTYRAAVGDDYDGAGAWGDGDDLADHAWAWNWYRLQADLSPELRVRLD